MEEIPITQQVKLRLHINQERTIWMIIEVWLVDKLKPFWSRMSIIYIFFEEIPTTKQVKLRLYVDQKKTI